VAEAHIKAQDEHYNKTYKNINSKSIKKGKDTRVHRSLRVLPELERMLDSQLLIGLRLCYYY
jgi:hypothetical protein